MSHVSIAPEHVSQLGYQRDDGISVHREVLLEHLVDVLAVDRVDALLAGEDQVRVAAEELFW